MRLALLLIALNMPVWSQDAATKRATNLELQKQIEQMCDGKVIGYISNKEPDPRMHDGNGNPWAAEHARSALAAFIQSSEKLMPIFQSTYPGERLIIMLSSSKQISSWAFGSWLPHNHLVCIPTAFVDFITNEDELAFMIGHEIGHTRDPEPLCGSYRAYAQLNREQQVACESRADEIGYWFLRRAGYSPYAAAGGFGRLEMYSGDTQTGLTGMLHQMNINHPITPKRIENMRKLLIEESRGAR